MYPRLRLTWDDELRLSDDLHAARVVRDSLGDAGTATVREQQVLDAGVRAADEMVIAHSGLARRIASEVIAGSETSAALDFDDLVQIGLIAMYTCTNWFDARRRSDGIAVSTGNRFSVYSRQYIKREMVRAIKKGNSTLSGSIATADRTREWMKHRDEMEAKLGFRPTPRQVSESCGIALSTIDMTLIGRKAVLGQSLAHDEDHDDAPGLDAPDPERTGDVDDEMLAEDYIVALDSVLREVLEPGEADAFELWIGLDRDFPRSMKEVADDMGVRLMEANELVGEAVARLRHPQNVGRISRIASEALSRIEAAHTPVPVG